MGLGQARVETQSWHTKPNSSAARGDANAVADLLWTLLQRPSADAPSPMVLRFIVHYPPRWEGGWQTDDSSVLDEIKFFQKSEGKTFIIKVDKPTVGTKFGLAMTSLKGIVRVVSLADDSVFKKLGLVISDEILEVNGLLVNSALEAHSLLAKAPIGEVVLLVRRFSAGETLARLDGKR